MRKEYTQILKVFFSERVCGRRKALGLSQEKMAARLEMSSRTYADLDHGKIGCSALTLVLFLIYLCEDPTLFLFELRIALEYGLEHAA